MATAQERAAVGRRLDLALEEGEVGLEVLVQVDGLDLAGDHAGDGLDEEGDGAGFDCCFFFFYHSFVAIAIALPCPEY